MGRTPSNPVSKVERRMGELPTNLRYESCSVRKVLDSCPLSDTSCSSMGLGSCLQMPVITFHNITLFRENITLSFINIYENKRTMFFNSKSGLLSNIHSYMICQLFHF